MRLKQYTELVDQLKDASVEIERAANPEGTLYGSVGAKDIAAALQGKGLPDPARACYTRRTHPHPGHADGKARVRG